MMRKIPLVFLLLCLAVSTHAELLTVTLLGTGTPRPSVENFGAAVLVEAGKQKLLFDAGRGVAQRIFQIYVPFQEIDKVFISHMHYDHLIGLPDLMLTGWVFQRQGPISLWGPPALVTHMDYLKRAYHDDIAFRRQYSELSPRGINYQVHTIKPGVVYEQDDFVVTAFEVDHHPVAPAYGYRIDYAGQSVVISGDTRSSEGVLKYARGVDLLIHEVAAASESLRTKNPRLQKIMDYHTNPDDLANLIAQAKPGLVVLTHVLAFEVSSEELLQRTSAGHTVPIRMGKDLMAFDIGDSIREYSRPQ